MPQLTLPHIEKTANALWQAPGTLAVTPDGQQCRLTHQQRGVSVVFDLTRGDLMLSAADFSERVLAPALAALREKLA